MSQQILWALVAQTGVIVAGVVVVVLYNNARFNAIDRRFNDLRSEMNHRLDDLKSDLVARIEALDKRLSEKIDAVEKRLIERIERLEHPVSRQP